MNKNSKQIAVFTTLIVNRLKVFCALLIVGGHVVILYYFINNKTDKHERCPW